MKHIHSNVTELPLSCKSAAEHMARELEKEELSADAYDDGNIPDVDLPQGEDRQEK